MKEALRIFFATFLLMCSVAVFTACSDGGHTHTPAAAVRENEISATCKADGSYDNVVYCTDCGEEISREKKSIEKIAHTAVTDEAKAPTCTEPGLTEGTHCSVCNEVIAAQETVKESGHNYVNRICTRCDDMIYSTGIDFVSNNDGTCYVDGIGTCEDSYVIIPPTSPNGDNVTSINSFAFENITGITSIVIPDSVTSIGYSAFSGCTNLTSIEIPDSVTSIGDYAFYGCTSLNCNEYDNAQYLGNSDNPYIILVKAIDNTITSCNIHKDTKFIHSDAFFGCTSLTSIEIPDSVTSIGDDAFYGCASLKYNEYDNAQYLGNSDNPYIILVKAIDNTITSCNIHKDTKFIHSDAFFGFISLTSIIVNSKNQSYKSVDGNLYTKDGKTLIQYAVGKSDKTFTIPDGVTSISDYAFRGCTSLTSIEIPDGVTSIGVYAFRNCRNLTSVVIGDSVTSIGSYAFAWCYSLTSIEIPDSVTSIGSYAFYCCTSLTSIEIPDSVTSIGSHAFYSCTSLTSIEIPDSVTSIGDRAFQNCTSLTSIIVNSENQSYKSVDGNLYTKDGKTLIQYAVGKSDKTFTVPDGVTSIGKSAFSGCTSLTSIEIPDNVTSIGRSAFSGCTSLTSIEIPNGVTSIGDYTFYGCTGLTSIEIPNGVTSIGDYAFDGCTSLESIEIPNSVTSIGDRAFENCTSLTNIEIPDSVTSIGYSAFSGCTSLTCIKIPDGVTSIGNYAFYGCTGLTTIEIPDSVTFIGDSAFSGCTSLTSVEFKNTSGWFVSTSSSDTSGESIDVSDTSKNADYLKSTYRTYYWKRNA